MGSAGSLILLVSVDAATLFLSGLLLFRSSFQGCRLFVLPKKLTSQTIQERSLDQGLWDQLISRAASSEPSSLARLCIPAGVDSTNRMS